MKAYEIWWAELPPPIGRRPVLLLTRSSAYDYLSKVIVVEITRTIRAIPQEVPVGRREGVSQRSVANLDNVHVVQKNQLRKRAGTLGPKRHHEIKRALGYALGWEELKVL